MCSGWGKSVLDEGTIDNWEARGLLVHKEQTFPFFSWSCTCFIYHFVCLWRSATEDSQVCDTYRRLDSRLRQFLSRSLTHSSVECYRCAHALCKNNPQVRFVYHRSELMPSFRNVMSRQCFERFCLGEIPFHDQLLYTFQLPPPFC